MHRRRSPIPLLALALALLPTLPAAAQVAGSISGVVRDAGSAPLAGATITAHGSGLPAAGLATVSHDDGGYTLAPLPAGVYRVSVDFPGLPSQSEPTVRVGVREDVTLDWTLPPPTVEDTLMVVSETPDIELSRTELSSRVTPQEIEDLPLNGRNFEDLVNLVPGVEPLPAGDESQRFSIFGERPAATSFVVDGADNNDPVDGGSLQRFTQDSIQEFEVLTSGYEAEFGRAQGGVVNVITRSGTDAYRGSAFLFRRDDSLDASNVPGQAAPQLRRSQWGATLGGPVRRDRAFFFLSGELLDETRGRNLDLTQVPSWVAEGLATPQGSENLGVGPETNRFTGLGKLDLTVSDRQRLSLVVNRTRDDLTGQIPTGIAGALVLPSGAESLRRNATSTTLRETWLAGPSSFLDTTAKVVGATTGSNQDLARRAETVLLLLRSGFLQTAAPLGGRSRRDLDRYELSQSYTHLAGGRRQHELKLGYDALRTRLLGAGEVTNDVEYSAAFLAPDAADVMEDLFRRFGFEQSAARFFQLSGNPDGSLDLHLHNTDLGLYAQDTWQARSGLTLDLGLRYDRASLFSGDGNNLAPRLGFAWDVGGRHATVVRGSAGIFYDRNALAAAASVPEKGGVFTRAIFDVALPRLGVDYTDSLIDLVITSGFPLPGGGRTTPENPLYTPLADALRADPLALYRLLGIDVTDPSTPPVVTADNIEALSGLTPDEALALLESTFPGTDWEFFDVPGGSIVGDRVLSFFPRGPLGETRTISRYSRDKTPWTRAFTLGIEQRLAAGITVSASYVYRRTRDLLTRRIVNLFDVPPGDPRFGKTTDGGPRVSQVTYDGRIDYQGVVISLRRPLGDRFGFTLSYTYSDARDNLLTGAVGSGFSNNNHPELDYGPSNLSVPHIAVGSLTTHLPWDIRLSTIAFWRSGSAFSPRGITDTDGDGLVDQRDLSVPRNSLRVAPYFELDTRLEKSFRLTSGHELTLLVDTFNLSNRANVAGVNAVSGPDFGKPNAFFPGREVQVGVRYFLGR